MKYHYVTSRSAGTNNFIVQCIEHIPPGFGNSPSVDRLANGIIYHTRGNIWIPETVDVDKASLHHLVEVLTSLQKFSASTMSALTINEEQIELLKSLPIKTPKQVMKDAELVAELV